MFYDQSAFDIRCEWGRSGVQFVGASVAAIIIVDVLSFSTCIDIATARGGRVYPFRWKDSSAEEYARKIGALLAGSRGSGGAYSLSPESMLRMTNGEKLVLPSPNGSELSTYAATTGCAVFAGCFRNCRAVALAAAALGGPIAVIPAGERWPDGTLRPAVEDLAATGAIIAELRGSLSPEAAASVAVWRAHQDRLAAFLHSTASGRELLEREFECDVRLASELNVSGAVPRLVEGAYLNVADQ